jgi:hypothetical protein
MKPSAARASVFIAQSRVAEGAKVPMKDSNGFKSASIDRAQIAFWHAYDCRPNKQEARLD